MSAPSLVSAADREFVWRCLAEYFARLPIVLRTGWQQPLVGGKPERHAYAVPSEMHDGVPDAIGRVRWKWLPVETPFVEYRRDDVPPTFWAYLHYHRLCRFVLRDERYSILLPMTPIRAEVFEYSKLEDNWQTGRWTEPSGYAPIGWTEDRNEVVCADMRRRTADGDAPIVAINRALHFRLRPQLLLTADPRPLLAPHARTLFGSFRDMLGHFCLGSGYQWTGRESFPFERSQTSLPPTPFDWEPWLDPELAPDQCAQDQTNREPDPRAVAFHLDRIAEKISAARALDPARLATGAAWHEYEMNPTLSAGEQQAFETRHGVRLPEAYSQFLMRLGNGGTGPGSGLRRLETLMFRHLEGNVLLSAPFPHRTAWSWAEMPEEAEAVEPITPESDPTRGSLILSKWPIRGDSAYALLVVTGPERGHVWVHRTGTDEPDPDALLLYREDTPWGISPVMRRGPYSFLAWYELHLDAVLAQADELYRSIQSKPQSVE